MQLIVFLQICTAANKILDSSICCLPLSLLYFHQLYSFWTPNRVGGKQQFLQFEHYADNEQKKYLKHGFACDRSWMFYMLICVWGTIYLTYIWHYNYWRCRRSLPTDGAKQKSIMWLYWISSAPLITVSIIWYHRLDWIIKSQDPQWGRQDSQDH